MENVLNNQLENGKFYQVSAWFPTAIYVAPDIVSDQENNIIIEKIKKLEKTIPPGGNAWHCNIYNTCGTYDLSKDNDMSFLFNSVQDHINEFVKLQGSNHQYQCQEAWANVSNPNSYQEYHTHADRTISAVYYAAVPENSGRIIFESPLEPDMLPIKKIDNYNYWSNQFAHFTPQPKMLLIFRSYLRHMVEMNKSDLPRMSIAMNF